MERGFTVWRFESPTTQDVKVVAKVSEPNDLQIQHEYQRVLWRGNAVSKEDALKKSEAVGICLQLGEQVL